MAVRWEPPRSSVLKATRLVSSPATCRMAQRFHCSCCLCCSSSSSGCCGSSVEGRSEDGGRRQNRQENRWSSRLLRRRRVLRHPDDLSVLLDGDHLSKEQQRSLQRHQYSILVQRAADAGAFQIPVP